MNYNYDDNDYFNEEAKKNSGKKKKPFVGTAVKIASFALIFGIAAGGGYYAIDNMNGNGSSAGTKTEKNQATVSLLNDSDDSNDKIVQKVSTDSVAATTVYDVSDVVQNTLPSIVSVTCSQYVSNNYSNYFGFGFGNGTDGSSNGTDGSSNGTGGSSNGTNQGNQGTQGNDGKSDSNGTLQQASAGTGIIIGEDDANLYLATNYHVVESADAVEITFADNSTMAANVKGYDSDADLAVLSIEKSKLSSDTLSAIKIAKIGDSNSASTGEAVIAIGNALGYGQSVTTGVISALNREVQLTDSTMVLLQTDAAINPGNSGGALLNASGELIGINTIKYASEQVEGMGYAIPISNAVPIIESLINAEVIPENEQGYLGITGISINEQYQKMYSMPAGVYIASVEDGSPAAKAGLSQGSIIVSFDGQDVTSMKKLSSLIKTHRAGDKVTMKVSVANQGKYEEHEVTVTLATKTEKTQ